jgi:diguanylate cyclase (GGDEF)-like protein
VDAFMEKDIVKKIIEQCSSIDNDASQVYQNLSNNAEKKGLKKFWKDTTPDVKLHSTYWDKLLAWADKGLLPQIFKKPTSVLEELESIHSKVDELIQRSQSVHDISKAFLIAFKLEFYLLHPAFETLFQYLKTVSEEESLELDYDVQINKLFEALNKYGLVTLELELLGEAIHRIWKENKLMAIQNNTDSLTGALNRRGLFNAIIPLSYLAQRNSYNIGIMMIDIDNFKEHNDNFGHQFGDEVLKYIAEIIKSDLRASDIFGRYGGDEFLVFLSAVDTNSFYDVGEKIRLSVEKGSKEKRRVKVSLGLAQGPIVSDVENALKELIKKADHKLYHAKNTGRNKVVL